MATFHSGQQTDHVVLPQQRALEFESADIPRIGDETGLEHRDAVPGVEPVRGETTGSAPASGGVTPEPTRAGAGDVPIGKRKGTHTGRVLVRARDSLDITTRTGRQAGIGHQHIRLPQRADGYGYTTRPEAFPAKLRRSVPQVGDAFPPGLEGPGFHTRSSR